MGNSAESPFNENRRIMFHHA
ncbi:uncharacterized protein G2W53_031189 [Senna tora]|uniref:Uncharacterized protein n=1 Tax=Senna tora TaxID=362788 RepID=A0A834WBI7_9FABA|nr:uncharacterized protein G2W53_031189 [Senna tora]